MVDVPRPKPPQNVDEKSDDGLTQSERFIKAAQELGTDDDPERFAERVRRLAKASSAVEATVAPAKETGKGKS